MTFLQSGLPKSGFLSQNFAYSGVLLAGLDPCNTLRDSNGIYDTDCQIRFYNDGHSVLRGVAAIDHNAGGVLIRAGQPVEFEEDGSLFFD